MRPLLVGLVVFVGVGIAVGCDKEKAGVEKLADQIAASNSASAAASASVNVIDPKEQKYALLMKAMRERNIAFMTSLQKLYLPGGKDEVASFLAFFPKDDKAQKEGTDLANEAVFTGKEGMSITRFDVGEVSLDTAMLHSTSAIIETQNQRGKPHCLSYTLEWESQAQTFVRTAKKDVRVIPCE